MYKYSFRVAFLWGYVYDTVGFMAAGITLNRCGGYFLFIGTIRYKKCRVAIALDKIMCYNTLVIDLYGILAGVGMSSALRYDFWRLYV